MNSSIVFTGGGTAGHVTPNLPLIDVLRQEGWQIDYIGSKDGVEKNMISALNIPYHAVSSGKLRRYFSWQNFLDPLKILLGIVQSYCLLRKLKPRLFFQRWFCCFSSCCGGLVKPYTCYCPRIRYESWTCQSVKFPFCR